MVAQEKTSPVLSARLAVPSWGTLSGESLTAVLEVFAPPPLALLELDVSFVGIERVDKAWVSPAWREGVKPLNADQRRVQRPLADAGLCAACRSDLLSTPLRRFVIQIPLPSWLPPSFRGMALRVAYQLSVTIRYRDLGTGPGGGGVGDDTAQLSPPGFSPVSAILQRHVRCAVQVWPRPGQIPSRAGLRALLAPGAPPALELWCWEAGQGSDLGPALTQLALRDRARTAADLAAELAEEEAEGEDSPGGGGQLSPRQSAEAEPDPGLGLEPAATRFPKAYALRMGNQAIGRVILLPPFSGGSAGYVPGDTVAVSVEFAQEGRLRCMQVEAALESEEIVAPGWRSTAVAATRPLRVVASEAAAVTAHSTGCGLTLSVPRDASPSFRGALCSFGWLLRFRFALVEQPAWAAPGVTPWGQPLETFEWTLPIDVVAHAPTQGDDSSAVFHDSRLANAVKN